MSTNVNPRPRALEKLQKYDNRLNNSQWQQYNNKFNCNFNPNGPAYTQIDNWNKETIWDCMLDEQCFFAITNPSNITDDINNSNLEYLDKHHKSFYWPTQIVNNGQIHNKRTLTNILFKIVIVFGTAQNNLVNIAYVNHV